MIPGTASTWILEAFACFKLVSIPRFPISEHRVSPALLTDWESDGLAHERWSGAILRKKFSWRQQPAWESSYFSQFVARREKPYGQILGATGQLIQIQFNDASNLLGRISVDLNYPRLPFVPDTL
ncbi:hypothetical protein N7470_010122 [Penicillium chermesinum]|nr:hypothetical protein N7470_010122 [Penicillium chermesinum]